MWVNRVNAEKCRVNAGKYRLTSNADTRFCQVNSPSETVEEIERTSSKPEENRAKWRSGGVCDKSLFTVPSLEGDLGCTTQHRHPSDSGSNPRARLLHSRECRAAVDRQEPPATGQSVPEHGPPRPLTVAKSREKRKT